MTFDGFLELALIPAVMAGVISAMTGSRTALVLLASVGFSEGLCLAGVPFSFPLWFGIDLMAIALIIHPRMNRRDAVILALFIPAWASYLAGPPWLYPVGMTVVEAQLFLTFPILRAIAHLRAWIERKSTGNDNFEMAIA